MKCNLCDKFFDDELAFAFHSIECKRIFCKFCSSYEPKDHYCERNSTPKQCRLCTDLIPYKQWVNHKNICKYKYRYQCLICDFVCSNQQRFNEHSLECDGINNRWHKCRNCVKKFRRYEALVNHLETCSNRAEPILNPPKKNLNCINNL